MKTKLTLDDVFELSTEELRVEFERLGQDTTGMSEVQVQKWLLKAVYHKMFVEAAEAKKRTEEAEREQRKRDREMELERLRAQLEQMKVETQEMVTAYSYSKLADEQNSFGLGV